MSTLSFIVSEVERLSSGAARATFGYSDDGAEMFGIVKADKIVTGKLPQGWRDKPTEEVSQRYLVPALASLESALA